MKKIRNISADRLVSISAIVVSLATLIMILYQTNLMRTEQKASVMPSLIIGYNIDVQEHEFTEKISIFNQGLGPAFIEKIQILDKSKVYETDVYGYLSKTDAKNETKAINRLFPGRVIPADEKVQIYSKTSDSTSSIILGSYFAFPYELTSFLEKQRRIDPVIIRIVYSNVYGDKWEMRSDRPVPKMID